MFPHVRENFAAIQLKFWGPITVPGCNFLPVTSHQADMKELENSRSIYHIQAQPCRRSGEIKTKFQRLWVFTKIATRMNAERFIEPVAQVPKELSVELWNDGNDRTGRRQHLLRLKRQIQRTQLPHKLINVCIR